MDQSPKPKSHDIHSIIKQAFVLAHTARFLYNVDPDTITKDKMDKISNVVFEDADRFIKQIDILVAKKLEIKSSKFVVASTGDTEIRRKDYFYWQEFGKWIRNNFPEDS